MKQVFSVIRKAGNVFSLITKNPVGFVKNLVMSVHQGFTQFKDNIWEHLKKRIIGWLFGSLSKTGLQMPEKFNLKSNGFNRHPDSGINL